jgi:D-alanyl-D-alanine carboxypeptidase/D-alanyl-D-alanine-endopeptidase (penicillin-binding protein 4)
LAVENLNYQSKIVNRKSSPWARKLTFIILAFWFLHPDIASAELDLPCLKGFTSADALIVAHTDGRILFSKNDSIKCVPASTLKLLTALAAINHLGTSYRFPTEFYIDTDKNLKVKGFGDPLLVSEAWQEIADALAEKTKSFRNLILDDTYFSPQIVIPGRKHSTNPYDAPIGALCANFNTVFFHRNQQGRIVSSEPQTPLIPFARKKIQMLGLKRGRYTFSHDRKETTLYAGHLLRHFLKQRNVNISGKIYLDTIELGDRLIYHYRSRFSLEDALRKMMAFSNNFMANQIVIALGAQVYGPPGTLAKGVNVVSGYAHNYLNLQHIEIVEGSGISRKNRVSAMDMLTILKAFRPYRHLLRRAGDVLYKTGTLRGISTRVGYIEGQSGGPYCFVIFLKRSGSPIDGLMRCVKQILSHITNKT